MKTYEVKLKGVSEERKPRKMKYIVTNAISCGQAESHVELDVANLLSDVNVQSVQVKTIADILNKDADRLWYVKIAETILDETMGKEKKVTSVFLVGAESAKEAGSTLMAEMKEFDCEVVNISDSKIDCVISAL